MLLFGCFRKQQKTTAPLGPDLSTPLYQALIEIRDEPRRGKKVADAALKQHRPSKHLFRAMIEVRRNPGKSYGISGKAIHDATVANEMARTLDAIRKNPRKAHEFATQALLKAGRQGVELLGVGARCSGS